jgi:hypothetical protein
MSTALTVYMQEVNASSTLSTSNALIENGTTQTGNTNKNTTLASGTTGWGEVVSQGNSGVAWAAAGAAFAPTGLGWVDDATTLVGNHFDTGNWTANVRHNITSGTLTADIHVYAYKRSSGGVYTFIADMVASAAALTTVQANYTCTATGVAASASFVTGDKLYIYELWNITSSSSGTTAKIQQSSSATQGYVNGAALVSVVTPGYLASTLITKDVAIRGKINALVDKDVVLRGRTSQIADKDVKIRGNVKVLVNKDVVIRGRTKQLSNKDVAIRGRTSQVVSKDVVIRANVGLTSKRDVAIRGRTSQQSTKDVGLRGRTSQIASKDIGLRGRPAPTVDKDIVLRANVSQLSNKDVSLRGRTSQQSTKDVGLRGRTGTTVDKDVALRGRTSQIASKDVKLRGNVGGTSRKDVVLRARITGVAKKDVAIRGNISNPEIQSGGVTLFANGTGTVSYDHLRWTEYPDPALCLSPITPRVGNTTIVANALTPINTTAGFDTSLDGVNWTDETANNGGNIIGIFSQPDPTIDGFGTNTSANYTSTFRTGGSALTATYDTANSRIILTGGTNGIYLYTAISRADIDFFADLDQSDAGGLVWRFVDSNNYYWLDINDTLTASGPNTITLYKVAANVQTQLATAVITYNIGTPSSNYNVYFTRGTFRRFRVTMLLGVITCYMDGVQLLTYIDGSPLGAGKLGLYNSGGIVGSRYYQLWMVQLGDYVSGTPALDIVTSTFVYTRQRLATTDPTVSPQFEDITTMATTPEIGVGGVIPSVAYNSSYVSSNFDGLAKASGGYTWYIDQNKHTNFHNAGTVAAPWILQSAPAGLVSNVDLEVDSNLELDVTNPLYRNRQIILGALAPITPPPATYLGDGNVTTFTLGYPLSAKPTITLNGVPQSVGLKGTTGSAFYYALNDAVIQQDALQAILKDTDQLTITYIGLYAITVAVDDVTEQAARALIEKGSGIVENVEDHTSDVPPMLEAQAIAYAQSLINRNAIAGRTLIFNTSRTGLALGATLSIFLPEHGIWDGQFSITQVELKLKKDVGDTQVWWSLVTCSELPRQASWAKLLASGLGLI